MAPNQSRLEKIEKNTIAQIHASPEECLFKKLKGACDVFLKGILQWAARKLRIDLK